MIKRCNRVKSLPAPSSLLPGEKPLLVHERRVESPRAGYCTPSAGATRSLGCSWEAPCVAFSPMPIPVGPAQLLVPLQPEVMLVCQEKEVGYGCSKAESLESIKTFLLHLCYHAAEASQGAWGYWHKHQTCRAVSNTSATGRVGSLRPMPALAEHIANPTKSTGIQGKGIERDKQKKSDRYTAKKKALWATKKKM